MSLFSADKSRPARRGGARLRVEDPQFVKPQFQLKFDRTSPGRACKVAWKKGDVIGIKFV